MKNPRVYRLENVRLVLGVGDNEFRKNCHGGLSREGFRNINVTDAHSKIENSLADDQVDLLIVEISLSETNLCGLIRAVRHNHVGNDPFPVTIGLIGEARADLIKGAINAGFDDILIQSVSVEALNSRIFRLMNGRKPFVITTDYIGPHRRTKDRQEGREPLFLTVPNPLKIKAYEEMTPEEYQHMVAETVSDINEKKVESHAVHITELVEKLLPRYERGEITGGTVKMLERLMTVSTDLAKRLSTTNYTHVSDLCDNLVDVAVRLFTNPSNPDGKDVELLLHLSQAIAQGFEASVQIADIAHDISRTVSKV